MPFAALTGSTMVIGLVVSVTFVKGSQFRADGRPFAYWMDQAVPMSAAMARLACPARTWTWSLAGVWAKA